MVDDAELLYRSVRNNAEQFTIVDGTLRLSANAFNDPGCKPSVDRSSMRENPADARLSATDGVVAVSAQEVRSIGHIRVNPANDRDARAYVVDAIHRPLSAEQNNGRENSAHCQVECQPGINRTHFNKKLREALAKLAQSRGWIFDPR